MPEKAAHAGTAAMGLRVHSGWAALVVLAGDRRSPRVVRRRRIDMADAEDMEARHPYHAAQQLDLSRARELLERLRDDATEHAHRDLTRALDEVGPQGLRPRTAVVLMASGRLPLQLQKILASHAAIHTAEGAHFREALAQAGQRLGLNVIRLPERLVLGRAAEALGLPAEDLRARVGAMGRGLGPPWTADQKSATLGAWLILATEG